MNASGPAPLAAMETASRDIDAMQEDIGVLQGTVVRADLRQVGSPLSLGFWRYFWSLLKAKATGLYSRSHYRMCIQKIGWTRYLPVETGNNPQLRDRAKRLYEQFYKALASGDATPIQDLCLPPILRRLDIRIASRGPITMTWNVQTWKSARVVSHRASAQSEDVAPDTAYRQVVIRLETVQVLSIQPTNAPTKAPRSSTSSARGVPRWVPDGAPDAKAARVVEAQSSDVEQLPFVDNGVPRTVVEYLVMQRRVVRGVEENWKIWGFMQPSTPASLKVDESYWRKTLDANLAMSRSR
ncbi:hypothetical protein P153DRAFT_364690 [Dothidotthia symphoricarpi CBS 119687]|uniref:Uncharacterized protein n=1 Tax=Dothidotthia symphoricarpi CBS 119687 TaxID=1392245 RepID=A0A6A6AMA1_9PLEO|nr:uncharacterized protein P153DRAFT_364690 [Dothidotthia symphoricarpi CBS 119687]KAF2132258.1 hypothetical protein P153DRAFT_364690 [Dothidotthia symphoricarpi CBS 119687]